MIQDASFHRVIINALEGNSDKRRGGRNSNEKYICMHCGEGSILLPVWQIYATMTCHRIAIFFTYTAKITSVH